MKRNQLRCSSKAIQAAVLLTAVLALVGCGKSTPDITPVSGTITVNGKPYARVKVSFYPTTPGLDGNMVGSGVTDKDGKYTLSLPGKEDAGSPVGECKVTITEGPMPDSVRENDQDGMASTRYLKSLRDRPIPVIYNRMGDTPLTTTVTKDKAEYNFELKK